jgi:hypothetical protein
MSSNIDFLTSRGEESKLVFPKPSMRLLTSSADTLSVDVNMADSVSWAVSRTALFNASPFKASGSPLHFMIKEIIQRNHDVFYCYHTSQQYTEDLAAER